MLQIYHPTNLEKVTSLFIWKSNYWNILWTNNADLVRITGKPGLKNERQKDSLHAANLAKIVKKKSERKDIICKVIYYGV